MRRAAPILLLACLHAVLLHAAAVQAQTLQSLVIGADVAVAIPPRGAAALPPPPRPALAPPAVPLAVVESGLAAGVGLAAGPLPLFVPFAAALALGGGLPGSGGSGSAPATTR